MKRWLKRVATQLFIQSVWDSGMFLSLVWWEGANYWSKWFNRIGWRIAYVQGTGEMRRAGAGSEHQTRQGDVLWKRRKKGSDGHSSQPGSRWENSCPRAIVFSVKCTRTEGLRCWFRSFREGLKYPLWRLERGNWPGQWRELLVEMSPCLLAVHSQRENCERNPPPSISAP